MPTSTTRRRSEKPGTNGRPCIKGRKQPSLEAVVVKPHRQHLQISWYGGGCRQVAVVTGTSHWLQRGRGIGSCLSGLRVRPDRHSSRQILFHDGHQPDVETNYLGRHRSLGNRRGDSRACQTGSNARTLCAGEPRFKIVPGVTPPVVESIRQIEELLIRFPARSS
jgi:hypothetical protein